MPRADNLRCCQNLNRRRYMIPKSTYIVIFAIPLRSVNKIVIASLEHASASFNLSASTIAATHLPLSLPPMPPQQLVPTDDSATRRGRWPPGVQPKCFKCECLWGVQRGRGRGWLLIINACTTDAASTRLAAVHGLGLLDHWWSQLSPNHKPKGAFYRTHNYLHADI